MHQYPRVRPARDHIAGMVRVHKARDNNRLTFDFGHIWWEFLGNVPVEVPPICICIEHSFIDLGRLVIKNDPGSVLMFLQVSKYMVVDCFEVSPTRQRLMLGQL